MIRTVAIVKWAADASSAEVAEFLSALSDLPDAVGVVKAFSVGQDIALREGNYDLVVIADFDSELDFLLYNDHPAHQRIRDRWLGSLVFDPAVVQYEL